MKRTIDAEYLHADIVALMNLLGNNANQCLAPGKAVVNSLTLTPWTGLSAGHDGNKSDCVNHDFV